MTTANKALPLDVVPPCARCADPGGKPTRPHLGRPGRLDGRRYGIDGAVCIDCWRNARRVLRHHARRASVRPCDLCADPGGRVAGRAVNPSRYDGTHVGRPGLLVCHACRYPPDPDDRPDPAESGAARRLRDERVRAAALAIRAEVALEVEARLRRREAQSLPPTLEELVRAALARERARKAWTFGPATPIGVQQYARRSGASEKFLNPRQRLSGERWSR